MQQPNFADFSHFREEVSIKYDFLRWFVLDGVCKCSKQQHKLSPQKGEWGGKISRQTQKFHPRLSAFLHSPIFRPPSQILRRKCVTEVAFVKYTGLYFKTQMNSKVMTAVYIKLQASEYVKDLFMAEVTCRSFRLNLFNLILFVLHLSFLTLFYFFSFWAYTRILLHNTAIQCMFHIHGKTASFSHRK